MAKGQHSWWAIRRGAPACLWLAAAMPVESASRITVDPARLEVSTFCGGASVQITVQVDPGNVPIIVVRGPETEEVFERRARFGPIWITSGRARVSGAPTLLLSLTTAPLEEIVTRADIHARQLDARAVRARLRVQPASADTAEVRESFLALKASDGSFRTIDRGDARVQPGTRPGVFVVRLAWPTRARPGTYTVTAYECCDRRVTAAERATLEVVQVGLSAWLAEAASKHATLYGMVAVGVTLVFGFGIDFVVTATRRTRARRWRGTDGHAPTRPAVHLRGNDR